MGSQKTRSASAHDESLTRPLGRTQRKTLQNLLGRLDNQTAQSLLRGTREPDGSMHSSRPLDVSVAATARDGGTPSQLISAPRGLASVPVYDSPRSHSVAEQLGVQGFSYRGDIFLGRDLDAPGGPGRDRVVKHELTHALQARQHGPAASREAVEREAGSYSGNTSLLSADPAAAYGFLWIPIIIAGGYILLKPNTANAPGPNDPTYASMTTGDYVQMVGEAAVLASGYGIAAAIKKKGYSLVVEWGVTGAFGSVGFRAASDIGQGRFSGVGTYVVDALSGAVVGIVAGGVFYGVGRLPGFNRIRTWYRQGAQNDAAWRQLSMRDKAFYEIGQKTLPAGQWEPLAALSPVERGRAIVQEQGWLRGLLPRSGGFMVPGPSGTLSTGPTPAFRWFAPRVGGFVSGGVGRHALFPDWENGFGQIPDAGSQQRSEIPSPLDQRQSEFLDLLTSPILGIQPNASPLHEPQALNSQIEGLDLPPDFPPELLPALMAPMPGWDTIQVVPVEREVEYLIRSGRVGDFPTIDVPRGELREYYG